MSRHTYFGQLAAHDVMNGIDHANIALELTVENWESKAIIRGVSRQKIWNSLIYKLRETFRLYRLIDVGHTV